MSSNTFSDFISHKEYLITEIMIDNIENKTENLRLQEYSLKNRSFWKFVIALEKYQFLM